MRLAFTVRPAGGRMWRMNALVADLNRAVPKERRPALEFWGARLKAIIVRSFADSEDRLEASKQDRQGLGMPRQHSQYDDGMKVNEAINQKHTSG